MNKESLEKILKEKNIRKSLYSLDEIDGYCQEDTICLRESYGIWSVFYMERGIENDLKEFNNESEACKYFLDYILKDNTAFY